MQVREERQDNARDTRNALTSQTVTLSLVGLGAYGTLPANRMRVLPVASAWVLAHCSRVLQGLTRLYLCWKQQRVRCGMLVCCKDRSRLRTVS